MPLAYGVLYPRHESLATTPLLDDIALRFTATTGHFWKEIVMRNFIYAITLVGLGVLQLAIQVVEFARV